MILLAIATRLAGEALHIRAESPVVIIPPAGLVASRLLPSRDIDVHQLGRALPAHECIHNAPIKIPTI